MLWVQGFSHPCRHKWSLCYKLGGNMQTRNSYFLPTPSSFFKLWTCYGVLTGTLLCPSVPIIDPSALKTSKDTSGKGKYFSFFVLFYWCHVTVVMWMVPPVGWTYSFWSVDRNAGIYFTYRADCRLCLDIQAGRLCVQGSCFPHHIHLQHPCDSCRHLSCI